MQRKDRKKTNKIREECARKNIWYRKKVRGMQKGEEKKNIISEGKKRENQLSMTQAEKIIEK